MDAVAVDVPRAEIAESYRRYEVAAFSLFGSAAKGAFGAESDDDEVVVFKHPLQTGFFTETDVPFAREELLGRNADLVPKNGLKPFIRDEVIASAQATCAVEGPTLPA